MASPHPPILRLPAEVLWRILESVYPGDFHNLCLVSRQARDVVTPFLYTRIRCYWTTKHRRHITSLLRTVLSKPELAHQIQRFQLRSDMNTVPHSTVATIPLPEAEVDTSIAFVRRTEAPFVDDWIDGIRRGTVDAVFAVLLCHLPSLRSLSMTKDLTNEFRILGSMLNYALCTSHESLPGHTLLPTLVQLTEVMVHNDWTGQGDNSANISPFFHLPAVRRTWLCIDNPSVFKFSCPHKAQASMLTTLRLGIVREGYMGHILSATPNLRVLLWDWNFRPYVDGVQAMDVLDLDQLGKDLSQVRETLTHLSIFVRTDYYENRPLPQIRLKGSLKNISSFPMLKTLEAPLPFLQNFSLSKAMVPLAQILPRSLEFLMVTEDMVELEGYRWWYKIEEGLLPCIRSWLEVWRSTNPHLRELGFRSTWRERDGGKYLVEEAGSALTDLGKEFGVMVRLLEVGDDWSQDRGWTFRWGYVNYVFRG